MNEELVCLVGTPGRPLTRLRDKTRAKELQRLVEEAASPEIQLRAALCAGMQPPERLLKPEIIAQGLSLGDCWKFFRQLVSVQRVVEAGSFLEAVGNLIKHRDSTTIRAAAARLCRLSVQWEQRRPALVPSQSTVSQFLELAKLILDRRGPAVSRPPRRSATSSGSLDCLVAVACKWAVKHPTVHNLVLGLGCLTTAGKRHGIRMAEAHGDQAGPYPEVSLVRSLAADHLERCAARGEINDFSALLRALLELPTKEPEKEELIKRLLENRGRYDPAISRVVSAQFLDAGPTQITIEFAPGSEPAAETVRLATALLAAWAARADGQRASEAYEELRSALESFFSLRLLDCVGQIQDYNPREHEFAFDEMPASRVEVLRPAVELVRQDKSQVVVKAVVKAVRS